MLAEPLESYEVDYIKEMASKRSWSVELLANKLDRPEREIKEIVLSLGIKVKVEGLRVTQRSWEDLWYAYLTHGKVSDAAKELSFRYDKACAAIKRMSLMTEAERIVKWNIYRQKHGMPLFTKC